MIVLMAGLPGSGKTTLARQLAARTLGRVLSKDELRHSLFAAEEIEYSTHQDDLCLQIMLEVAGSLFSREPNRMIFLDGRPFSRRYQIDNVLTVAASLHQQWRILECICADDIAQRRLRDQCEASARQASATQASAHQVSAHPAGNRDFELYLDVKGRFENITLPKTLIDTSQALEACVEQALAGLRAAD